MQQRSGARSLPYVAASFVIPLHPDLLFPLAIFVYKIVRPHEKIGETYERNLAEEALLAEVEAIKSCPTCARRVNEEWIICPTVPDPPQPRLPELQPARRARLVAVRLVRQGLRAARSALAGSTGGSSQRRSRRFRRPMTRLRLAAPRTRHSRTRSARPEPTERAAGAAPPPRAPRRRRPLDG